jgi:hypothetical protein
MTRLRTEAWLLRGISSLPGELRLASGNLSFTSSGTGSTWPFQLRKLGVVLAQPGLAKAVEEGKPFQFFVWPARDVEVVVPWYYFGGGMKLRYQGIELRFSFGRPASSRQGLASVAADLKEVGAMRGRGRLWAEALAKATARNTDDA